MPLNRTAIYSIAAVVAVGSVAVGLLYAVRSSDSGKPTSVSQEFVTFQDSTSQLTFSYDSQRVTSAPLTTDDEADGFLARLEPAVDESSSPFVVSVRRDSGYRAISSVSGQSLPEIVLDNIGRSYPDRFPGFRAIRQQTLSVGGVNAAEIVFLYDGPAGQSAKQHLLALAINDDEVILLSFQALEQDFELLDQDIFQPLRDSIQF